MKLTTTAPAQSPDLIDRQRVFDEWIATVRDPSEKAAEGWRTLWTKNRRGIAQYQTAALPDGTWGLRTACQYPGFAGSFMCWEAFPTRDACVTEFLRLAHGFFDPVPTGCANDSHREARVEMVALLSADSLFGFVEPEPSVEPDDPIVDDDASDDETEE